MNRPNGARLMAWAGALVLIALPIALLVAGGFGAERWPFRRLVSHGAFVHVSEQQVKTIAQPLLSGGYFGADLDKVRSALQSLPWVERVEVRKVWPDLLDISVFEREPVARWNGDRLLNRDGSIFSVPEQSFPPNLPSLFGPDARAAEILAGFREVGTVLAGAGLTVVAARMSERGSWRYRLGNDGELSLDDDPELAQQRLARFVAVFRELPGAEPDRLLRADLRYTNGFAIAWAPSAPAAADTPSASAVPEPNPVPTTDNKAPRI
ncbi:MAG: cell division protein FtsQ/DivIB [Lysobacterales bacterium]